MEKKIDGAKEETRVAAVVVGDSKAKAEGDLVRVQDVLAVEEEARAVAKEAIRKAEVMATHLEVE